MNNPELILFKKYLFFRDIEIFEFLTRWSNHLRWATDIEHIEFSYIFSSYPICDIPVFVSCFFLSRKKKYGREIFVEGSEFFELCFIKNIILSTHSEEERLFPGESVFVWLYDLTIERCKSRPRSDETAIRCVWSQGKVSESEHSSISISYLCSTHTIASTSLGQAFHDKSKGVITKSTTRVCSRESWLELEHRILSWENIAFSFERVLQFPYIMS